MQVALNSPQFRFLQMPQKFRAYVGGYRSGKTLVGCVARLDHFLRHPGVNQGYFAPTYPQIRDIFYPTIEKACSLMGLWCDVREGNKEVHVFNGSRPLGTIICRSMEKPETIIGFEIGDALCDEIDTMPFDKASKAWARIIARMSHANARNGVDVTTTPEGFRFVYERFHENPSPSYGLIQASTYDNAAHLPPDYISSLIETYPAELIEAYLEGRFVNLTSGTVYRNFDRVRCASEARIEKGDVLHIGQDFNVGQMASVVHVKRGEAWHAVDELSGGLDTPAVCSSLRERYPEHRIVMYPDASGRNRSTKGASVSDITLLSSAGFLVRVPRANPLVRDRVLSMNMAFSSGKLYVNTATCPEYTQALEQQAYDRNGEPDKTSGHDHMLDAAGYFVFYEMPINRPAITPRRLPGMH